MAAMHVASLGYQSDTQSRLARELTQRGYTIHTCSDPASLLRTLRLNEVKAVLLGPGLHRQALVGAILPILKEIYPGAVVADVPAMSQEDRDHFMQAGADLCIEPDASSLELGDALHRLISRKSPQRSAGQPAGVGIGARSMAAAQTDLRDPFGLASAPWVLMYQGWVLLTPTSEPVHLSAMEHTLFECLVDNPQRELSRQMLSKAFPSVGLRSLNVTISRLRRKVEKTGCRLPLQTVHRMGYVFTGELLATQAANPHPNRSGAEVNPLTAAMP